MSVDVCVCVYLCIFSFCAMGVQAKWPHSPHIPLVRRASAEEDNGMRQ